MSNQTEGIVFKTIEECQVRLVGRTVLTTNDSLLGDYLPCLAARVSYASDDKTGKNEEDDKRLMRYLAEHGHTSPFEYQHAVIMIECPLFVRSQIMRHRTFSFNEISRRYTSKEIGFWIPSTIRGHDKSGSNKQGSVDNVFSHTFQDSVINEYKSFCAEAYMFYCMLVDSGVALEQARSVLPQSLLTRFYMGGVLRNWMHFLKLRLDDHAQHETRVIAKKILDILISVWPVSTSILCLSSSQSGA